MITIYLERTPGIHGKDEAGTPWTTISIDPHPKRYYEWNCVLCGQGFNAGYVGRHKHGDIMACTGCVKLESPA